MAENTHTTIALPAIPAAEESLALVQVGEKLHESGLYPSLRSPAAAFAVVEYGRELGVGPMVALQSISIIQGKPAASGQLMLSLALNRGVTFKVDDETTRGCSITFARNGTSYTATFDEADAKAAGLLGKDNWKKFPKDMYFWRAVAKGVRRVCPEVVMGLYTPDELGATPGGVDTTYEEVPPTSKPEPEPEAEPEPPADKQASWRAKLNRMNKAEIAGAIIGGLTKVYLGDKDAKLQLLTQAVADDIITAGVLDREMLTNDNTKDELIDLYCLIAELAEELASA